MKKAVILTLFLSLLLVLGACGKKEEVQEGPFFGGNEGLNIEFNENEPLTQFGELDTVPVSVRVKNVGETDVETGEAKVKLFGINLDSFGLSSGSKANSKQLRGKSELFPEGGEQDIPLGDAKYKFSIRNSEDFTFRARVCYPYSTEARADICVSSKLLEEGRERICSIEGERIKSGTVSAGPIQVTSITETLRAADQVRFDIVIENKGAGDVYSQGTSCDDIEDDTLRNRGKDKVEVEIIQPEGVTCNFADSESNIGIVELENGKDVLTCWMTAEDTIKTKMNIKVNYRYVDRTERAVTIFESN